MSKIDVDDKMVLAKANRKKKRTPIFAVIRTGRKAESPKRRYSRSKIKKKKK